MQHVDYIIQIANKEDASLFPYLSEVLDTNGYKLPRYVRFPMYFRVNTCSNKITGYQDDLDRLSDRSYMNVYNRGIPIQQFVNLEEKPYEFW